MLTVWLIFSAMNTSFTLRVYVRCWVRNAFFAYCWVMVDPPWETPPPFTLVNSARRMPLTLTPGSL